MIAIQELSFSDVLVLDVPCNELEVELKILFLHFSDAFFMSLLSL